jgi:hypothetical protein
LNVQNYKIKKEVISINDSITWKAQVENTQTLIDVFSAGLQIKINPFITKFSKKDTIDESKRNSHIYIGKPKNFDNRKSNKNNYNIQLNDKITNSEDSLLKFLFCSLCKEDNDNYIIVSDSKINKSFIENIRNLMSTINIKEKYNYYRYLDTTNLKHGYKNIKEIDKYIK